MSQLLLTDFIKNRNVQYAALIGLVLDLLLSHTLCHILILLGMPYSTSIAIHYLMSRDVSVKPQARISEQYRTPLSIDIKITPK